MKAGNRLIVIVVSLLVVIIGSLTVGYFIGKSVIDETPKIKYVKGETVRDYFPILTPFKVTVPGKTVYITDPVTGKSDTAATVDDWNLKRDYKQNLFDNKNGKLDIDFSVQYNQPLDLRYSFTPIKEVSTIYKKKVWQPFISASYSTLNYVSVGGGVFYHDLGFEYQYQKDLFNGDTGHSFGIKYQF